MIDRKGEELRKVITSLEYKIEEQKQKIDCLVSSDNQVCTTINYQEIEQCKLELLLLETTCYSLKKYHILTVF